MPSKKPKKPTPAHLVPSEEGRSVREVLRATRQILETAKRGLEDINSSDPEGRLPGLYNVAAFGRAVTMGLQRLRNIAPGFDEWYAANVPTKDPLLNYFKDLRNDILKEARTPDVSTKVVLDQYVSGDPVLQGPPPPGARTIFVGEAGTGGSGWLVQAPDGSDIRYYALLSPSFQSRVTTHLPNAPTEHLGKPLADSSVATVAELYITFLEHLVTEAEHRF